MSAFTERLRLVYAPSLRFSVTVRSTNVPRPSGTWAMPAFAADSGPPLSCLPSSSIAPDRETVPEIARSVVVFPAPFAPSTATTSPSRTTSETSCSACTGP